MYFNLVLYLRQNNVILTLTHPDMLLHDGMYTLYPHIYIDNGNKEL